MNHLLVQRLFRLFTLLLVLAAGESAAHRSSDAFLTLNADQKGDHTLRIDVALRDLDRDLGIDADNDGNLRWGEVRAAWPRIQDRVTDAVRLRVDDRPCPALAVGGPRLDDHLDDAYAVLEYRYPCEGDRAGAGKGHSIVTLSYALFAKTDAGHRGLLRVSEPGRAPKTIVLVPSENRPVDLSTEGTPESSAKTSASGGFLHFVHEGALHIAAGLDHILFLGTLVLVTVFRRVDGRWTVEPSRRAVVLEALRIVTAFTLTHSITLGLAAAGVMAPSPRWVESLIAASVLVAAVDNIRPLVQVPRWWMAGLFGWFHGFGFAGPLQELGLRGGELVVPLLAFNLGVELGQLAVLALVLPIVLALRGTPLYRRRVMPALSLGVAVLATVWLAERSLALEILGT